MTRRVVITGQGAISALGATAKTTVDGMLEGRCAISALGFPNADRLAVGIGGQIKGYAPSEHFTRAELALFDPFTQFAVLSAREAVTQSGLAFDDALSLRSGVVLGSAGGGLQTQDENYRLVYEEGKNRVHPFVVPRLMMNAGSSQLSMIFGLRGACYTIATACASSNHAMGQAFHAIRSGSADVMLTGGSDSMLCFGGLKAWEGLRVMSSDGCRPFCATRNGMVQGEGAAVFVFEELEHARARGAEILAEVAGFSMTADAGDIVVPNQDGAARAISGALADGGLSPAQVGYVNAHGTATAVNDRTEIAALRSALGPAAEAVAVSSTKSMHGHIMGGTGAVELLSCIAAVKDGLLAPTVNYNTPDPECDLDIVANDAREATVDVAISNAFAFGGLNAVLALKRFA